MGDARDQLEAQGGKWAWVVAIEAYEYLLTSESAAAAIAAWAATPWTQALGGLRVRLEGEQRIDPWTTDMSPIECELHIAPHPTANDDTFGVDCHKGGGTVETYLETAVNCTATSLVGTDISAFAAAGDVYVGLERCDYLSLSAPDTVNVETRGKYAPFSVNGGTNTWGRAHPLPTVDYDVSQKPIISQAPRSWIGRWVGVWHHSVRNGVLCSKAEADLVFAGTITAIMDTTDGETIVRCVDLKERLNSTTLLHDQWTAKAAIGFELVDGTKFYVRTMSSTSGSLITNPLVVGVGIVAGVYTVPELCVKLTTWLQADANMIGEWTCWVSAGKFILSWVPTTEYGSNLLLYTDRAILRQLGFNVGTSTGYGSVETGFGDALTQSLFADNPFVTTMVITEGLSDGQTITLESSMGSWVNNLAWFPADIYELTDRAGSWGIIQWGDQLALAKYASATSLTDVVLLDALGRAMLRKDGRLTDNLTQGELVVRQVVILQGSLLSLVTSIFASTGTAAYNHATYDILPAQLGAAIPWELLGASFVSSLQSVGASTTTGALTIVLEQPTTLLDAIGVDLLLRACYLMWCDGALQWASLATPTAWHYDHAWTDSDKGSASKDDKQRTITQTTGEYLRNLLTIRANRAALTDGDSYNLTINAMMTRSAQENGGWVKQELDCRNSYSQYVVGGDVVEALAQDLMAGVLPTFGNRLKIMTRPISPAYYEGVRPGQIALITDGHARSPSTGRRGISAKPGLIIAHRRGYPFAGRDGDPPQPAYGEVDVLFLDRDRAAPYCPTALVTSWAAITEISSELTVSAHAYSESTDALDASHFEVGDKVILVEQDPADPAAPNTLAATITVVDGSTITINADIAGLTGTTYLLYSQTWADAAAAQKDHTYIADDGDGLISDDGDAFAYAGYPAVYASGAAPTELAERHSTIAITEGSALAVGPAVAMARNVNNLISYATALHLPALLGAVADVQDEDWVLIQAFEFDIAAGSFPSGYPRRLTIAPLMRTSSALSTASVRVTVSRTMPDGATGINITRRTPYGSLTFTSASATLGTATAQTIYPFHLGGRGIVYVEMKCADQTYHAYCWGLSKFWLGPLEVI